MAPEDELLLEEELDEVLPLEELLLEELDDVLPLLELLLEELEPPVTGSTPPHANSTVDDTSTPASLKVRLAFDSDHMLSIVIILLSINTI